MRKFTVSVIRTGYACRDIEVEANDPTEAKEKALDEAGGYEFSEHTAEYDVNYVEES